MTSHGPTKRLPDTIVEDGPSKKKRHQQQATAVTANNNSHLLENGGTGKIVALFRKVAKGGEMIQCKELYLLAGEGVQDDANRSSGSPRQLLLFDEVSREYLNVAPGAVRENVLVSGCELCKLPSGTEIVLGHDGAVVRLTFLCEPCHRLNPVLGTTTSLSDIVGHRGMLATVIKSGVVKARGGVVKIVGQTFESLPEKPEERFRLLLPRVPSGKVVTYMDVAEFLGVSRSAVRAIPMYIKRALLLGLPVHRVVDSSGALVKHVPKQRKLLEAEGTVVKCDGTGGDPSRCLVDLHQFRWHLQHDVLFGCHR